MIINTLCDGAIYSDVNVPTNYCRLHLYEAKTKGRKEEEYLKILSYDVQRDTAEIKHHYLVTTSHDPLPQLLHAKLLIHQTNVCSELQSNQTHLPYLDYQ